MTVGRQASSCLLGLLAPAAGARRACQSLGLQLLQGKRLLGLQLGQARAW